MSFPEYPEYKDSGVPWLGKVPRHWERKPLFALAKELDERNHGMQEDNLLSLSYGKIKRKNIEDNDGLLPASFETYQIVERDDIIWRLTDLQNDQRSLRTGIVRERGIITSAYLATRPTAVLPEFLAYLLRAYDLTKVFYSMGGGLRQSMKFSDVKWLPIMLPSEAEQAAIAAFLDRETAKIDALVAEQERLIALLKEKRQAVISHAVTKGLNPHAPMKDSGIEWLGEIPSHWELSKLKWSTAFITSGSRGWGDYYADEGPLFIRITNLTRDSIHLNLADEQRVVIPENTEGSRALLRPGDLLFSITAYLGSVGVVPNGIEEAYISQHIALCRLSADAPVAEWLGYTAMSVVGRTHFDVRGYGGTKVQLSLADVAEMPTLIPPEVEQRAILADLEMRLEAFRDLEVEAQAATTLLQERRAALISAAVTGKIDVRALVHATAEQEMA